MIYDTSDVIRGTPSWLLTLRSGLWSSLTEWIIRRIAHKRKLANHFILFKTIKKFVHVIYFPLYKLTVQVHHDSGHTSQLRSGYPTSIALPDSNLYVLTLVARHDFSHTSRLQSHILTLIAHLYYNRTSRLWSYISTPVVHSHVTTPGIHPDSDHTSRPRSYITTPVIGHSSGHTS
jgi:hypothetical protein